MALGNFSHYGATGPPYWAYAYPLAPWLRQTTLEHVRGDGNLGHLDHASAMKT